MKSWKPMFSAPKNGEVICCVQSDFSGIFGIFWGESMEEVCGWVSMDGEFLGDEHGSAGWCKLPEETMRLWQVIRNATN
jgi:hypothetical protein